MGFGLVLCVVCLLFVFGFGVSVLVCLRVGVWFVFWVVLPGFCVLGLLLGFVNGVLVIVWFFVVFITACLGFGVCWVEACLWVLGFVGYLD